MELLDLWPGEHGVAVPGIYVLDDEGEEVLAGPFRSEREAVGWIEATVPERTGRPSRVRHQGPAWSRSRSDGLPASGRLPWHDPS